jgi:hypothetical protein
MKSLIKGNHFPVIKERIEVKHMNIKNKTIQTILAAALGATLVSGYFAGARYLLEKENEWRQEKIKKEGINCRISSMKIPDYGNIRFEKDYDGKLALIIQEGFGFGFPDHATIYYGEGYKHRGPHPFSAKKSTPELEKIANNLENLCKETYMALKNKN